MPNNKQPVFPHPQIIINPIFYNQKIAVFLEFN